MKAWRHLRKLESGKTVLVLGNGPSLRWVLKTISSLSGVVPSIGVNGIVNGFLPTYLLMQDINCKDKPFFTIETPNTTRLIEEHLSPADTQPHLPFKLGLYHSFPTNDDNFLGLGHGVLYSALNLAAILDAKRIVLAGVDLYVTDQMHFYQSELYPHYSYREVECNGEKLKTSTEFLGQQYSLEFAIAICQRLGIEVCTLTRTLIRNAKQVSIEEVFNV